MAKPEAFPETGKIWLVFGLATSGNLSLLAVDTTERMAKRHVEYVNACEGARWIRVWIEQNYSNHLFLSSVNPMYFGQEMDLKQQRYSRVATLRKESTHE